MAFNKLGWQKIKHVKVGTAVITLHFYATEDDNTAIVTANYFDSIYKHLKVGDIILASIDIGGSPRMQAYLVTVVAATGTTVTAQVDFPD
jgi:hypothetical protein